MAIGIVLILVLAMIALAVYLAFPPQYANKQLVSTYNKITATMVVVLTSLFYMTGMTNMPFSPNLKGVISMFLALLVELVLLAVFFLVRNFWLFRSPRRTGSL